MYLKVAIALASAVFGAVVLGGGPRRAANRFLAAFLLLIAANQAFEAARGALYPAHGLFLSRAAAATAALDPLILYYFASLHPARNALNRPRAVGAVFAASAALTLAVPLVDFVGDRGLAPLVWSAAWATFTAAVYAVVLLHFLAPLLRGGAGASDRLMVLAVSLASVPAITRAAHALLSMALHGSTLPGDPLAVLMLVATLTGPALALAAAPLLARRAPDATRFILGAAAAGAALTVVLHASLLLNVVMEVVGTLGAPGVEPGWSMLLGGGSAAIRWFLFGLLASAAIVRHDVLGMTLSARRRAARALVAVAVVLAGSLLLVVARQALGEAATRVGPVEIAFLGAMLVVSQGFRQLVSRVATRAYGVPGAGDPAGALEAYRAAYSQALHEGLTPARKARLERLREELGLDARAAAVIERAVESADSGRLAPDRLVGGRYRVRVLLGRGGSGRAFLARDELIERDVVLKEVLHDDGRGEPLALREARLAGSLQHPNVVTVFDVVARSDSAIVVSEYAAGGSLAARVRDAGQLDVADALRVADDVLAGLEAAHERGIVHRDVKPENVFLDGRGRAKVGDFGIARVKKGFTASFQEHDAFQGTPEFMAPELLRGEPASPSSDLYAVGLMVRRSTRAPLPPGVERVVARATRDAPAERWASAAEMRAALRAALGEHALRP